MSYIESASASSGATVTSVAASASSVAITAGVSRANGCIITNNGSTILYLNFGSAAATATTANTVQIPSLGTFVIPSPVYTGPIQGIWAGSPTGSAQITTW